MSQYACEYPARNKSQDAFTGVVLLGPKLMASSLEQAGQLLRATSSLLSDSFSEGPSFKRSSCCDVPETECPPRCVCKIQWEASPGEHLKTIVRVTNTSEKQVRTFHFTATAFQGPGDPQVPLEISPADATLQPGHSTLITAEFTPTDAFQPGQTYEAEVLIKGAYEQCVCLQFRPLGEVQAECEVKQGDPPIHLRAHQWYDHFQCAEPCFPPSRGYIAPSKTSPIS